MTSQNSSSVFPSARITRTTELHWAWVALALDCFLIESVSQAKTRTTHVWQLPPLTYATDGYTSRLKTSIYKVMMRWNKGRHLRRFPLNVRAVSAKIKLPKKYLQHCHIWRTDKKNLSLLLLPSWPRKRKLDLKLSIFQLKRRFMSVQNKMAPVLAYFYEIWN